MAGHRERQRPRVPHLLAGEFQWPLRAPRRPRRDAPRAGGRRVGEQRERRPVVRILRQHSAHQIADHAGQPFLGGECRETAAIQLPPQDRRVIEPGQRHTAKRQRQHGHPSA